MCKALRVSSRPMKSRENAVPRHQAESDIRFLDYQRLLWRMLGVLARRGYVVPPGDARDLIHDFYLDAWPGLTQRFDPTLGTFATYVAAAFYRFARRRI